MGADAQGDTANLALWAQAHSQCQQWEAPVHSGLEHFDKEYELCKLIGKGSFGQVHEALHKPTGVEVAVKILRVSKGQGDAADDAAKDKFTELIRAEISSMSKCSSPYIISVIEAFSLGSSWRIVMELSKGRELGAILDETGALALDTLQAVTAQLAVAVLHIHSKGVVHRDLKPANMIVEESSLQDLPVSIKLIDFGIAHCMSHDFVIKYAESIRRQQASTPFSRVAYPDTEWEVLSPIKGCVYRQKIDFDEVEGGYENAPDTPVSRASFDARPAGTVDYAAPELFKRRARVCVSTDAFSVGAIMMHCVTGVSPTADIADQFTLGAYAVRCVKACMGRPVAKYRWLSQTPEDVRNIVKQLMESDVEKRMTVSQLCKTPYVREVPGVVGNPFNEAQGDMHPTFGRA